MSERHERCSVKMPGEESINYPESTNIPHPCEEMHWFVLAFRDTDSQGGRPVPDDAIGQDNRGMRR